MQRFGLISRGIAVATLLCFAAPQAEALEAYGSGTTATQLDDGLIVQVRAGRGGGGHRGGGVIAAEAACIAGAAACTVAEACTAAE